MMRVTFRTRKLMKVCSSATAMRKAYGTEVSDKLMRRLADLEAAETLMDVRALPGRCHELSGDRRGHLAMDLKHPYRLVFRPDEPSAAVRAGARLDWGRVTGVVITDICDYH